MMFARSTLATLCVAALVVIGLAPSSMADPLIITISQTNAGFTPFASATLDTAVFPPGFQNSASLSPSLITFYNTFFGTTMTDPFAGTGVNWVVNGQVNVPGQPDEGLLQGATILLHNSTATTYYAQIIIEGGDFTLPSSSGDTVLADVSFSSPAMQDASAWLYSLIDSTTIGTAWFNAPGVSPDQAILYTRGATYRLKQIFDITLNGNPTNDPNSNASISVTTTVTPVSEPWTVATLFAMMVPVGLLFHHLRQRKQLVYSAVE